MNQNTSSEAQNGETTRTEPTEDDNTEQDTTTPFARYSNYKSGTQKLESQHAQTRTESTGETASETGEEAASVDEDSIGEHSVVTDGHGPPEFLLLDDDYVTCQVCECVFPSPELRLGHEVLAAAFEDTDTDEERDRAEDEHEEDEGAQQDSWDSHRTYIETVYGGNTQGDAGAAFTRRFQSYDPGEVPADCRYRERALDHRHEVVVAGALQCLADEATDWAWDSPETITYRSLADAVNNLADEVGTQSVSTTTVNRVLTTVFKIDAEQWAVTPPRSVQDTHDSSIESQDRSENTPSSSQAQSGDVDADSGSEAEERDGVESEDASASASPHDESTADSQDPGDDDDDDQSQSAETEEFSDFTLKQQCVLVELLACAESDATHAEIADRVGTAQSNPSQVGDRAQHIIDDFAWYRQFKWGDSRDEQTDVFTATTTGDSVPAAVLPFLRSRAGDAPVDEMINGIVRSDSLSLAALSIPDPTTSRDAPGTDDDSDTASTMSGRERTTNSVTGTETLDGDDGENERFDEDASAAAGVAVTDAESDAATVTETRQSTDDVQPQGQTVSIGELRQLRDQIEFVLRAAELQQDRMQASASATTVWEVDSMPTVENRGENPRADSGDPQHSQHQLIESYRNWEFALCEQVLAELTRVIDQAESASSQ
ncbi:hypothetical protein [Halovenus sp. HT40]|uniref:hypothetical protein n=1 Tax=Halovenus sp. HT40 TaxID=3126691 RepID=UPI00300F390C